MFKKLLPIIISIIFISGCIGGDETTVRSSSTEGVVIDTFDFIPDLIESGDQGSLILKGANIGSVKAQNVKAHLYNTDYSIWGLSDPNVTVGVLYAPDTDLNVEGDSYTFSWDLTAPEIPEGAEPEYTFKVRVCYDYNTTATAKVLAVTSQERRLLQQQGKWELTDVITENSGAPIHFDVSARQPVIIYGDDESKEVRLTVKVSNTDKTKGVAYLLGSNCMSLGTETKNRVIVDVAVGNETCSKTVNLVEGGENEFTCNIPIFSDQPTQELNVIITSTYGFYVEKETTTTARPQFE